MNYNYESFNARNLEPDEVAQTFVPSKDYYSLWETDHTLVLGPRGSGKTTLFKMLTVLAIHSWEHPDALKLRHKRPFTAIYVPVDMHWHHQMRNCEHRLKNIPRLSEAFSNAAVTTSVLTATVKTFQCRQRYEAPENREAETRTCEAIIREWQLPSTLPAFESVFLALKGRISSIRSLLNSVARMPPEQQESVVVPLYFGLDYFAAMDVACANFDANFKLPQSRKWALCFDEMELAPLWLQTLALDQMKSSDQGYFIKISTSPIPAVTSTTGAAPRQDFNVLPIWNHGGHSNDEFSTALGNAVLSRRLYSPVLLSEFLGNSSDAELRTPGKARYSRQSVEYQLFRDLATWDAGFARTLSSHGIKPEDPYVEDIELRDQVLRKAKPLAQFRSAFLKLGPRGTLVLRSRKNTGFLYSGMEGVIRVCDGNPRRLIGVINDLVEIAHRNGSKISLPVDPGEQDVVLRRASSQFLVYLSAIPESSVKIGDQTVDLNSLLKTLATYFRDQVLGQEFRLDPYGSVNIDSDADSRLVGLVRLAVYHGALVHIDPRPEALESQLTDKRFRLSYMLSPNFRLPLTQYADIGLKAVLRSSKRAPIKTALKILDQAELPFND